MTIQVVEARTQARHHGDQHPQQVLVITGEQFRRDVLGWDKRKWYALVRSGRVQHLLAVNLSTARRSFYVRARAEAWATETQAIRGRRRA